MNEIGFSISPNPFNDETLIRYNLYKKQNALIEIFDLAGREVQKFSEEQNPGEYKYHFSPKQAGIYYVKLTVDNLVLTEKIISVK